MAFEAEIMYAYLQMRGEIAMTKYGQVKRLGVQFTSGGTSIARKTGLSIQKMSQNG